MDFLGDLYRQGLDSHTVSRHMVSLRNLFRFALAEEAIAVDPTLNLESPKMRRTLPVYLRMEEVDRLLVSPTRTRPLDCATAPSSRCCIPPACASRNWST